MMFSSRVIRLYASFHPFAFGHSAQACLPVHLAFRDEKSDSRSGRVPQILTVFARSCYKTSHISAMITLLSSNIRRRPSMARAIALLFLIYTGFDLASPELCKGEMLGDSAGKNRFAMGILNAKDKIETTISVEPSTG